MLHLGLQRLCWGESSPTVFESANAAPERKNEMVQIPKEDGAESVRSPPPGQQLQRSIPSNSAAPGSEEAISSISSSTTIVGKIFGRGILHVFGRIDGELRASTILISHGAEVEGYLVAEELTVGGRFKGAIHANRVRLNNSAVVEGDIFYRSLSIDENAKFEGSARLEDNVIDAATILTKATQPHAPVVSPESDKKLNGVLDNETRASPGHE
jgi:cytoskeletal protein CcmA (bactofilin family)